MFMTKLNNLMKIKNIWIYLSISTSRAFRCILYIFIKKKIYIYTYSGAKKYLVSHQLCKFSHLKRWEACTSTRRDKIRKKKSRKSHCRIFKEIICKLWWKISIWSITKFHLNTLLYTLCWQWQRSNVFCKSSQGFHTLLLVFWPIPPCRSPLEQWCFGAVAGQHGLSTPSKDFLWGWDLETG